MNFKKELCGIGKIIKDACFFERIREAATSISSHVVVSKQEKEEFPYIVRCAAPDCENIRKRLSSIDEVTVEKLAKDLLGIKHK